MKNVFKNTLIFGLTILMKIHHRCGIVVIAVCKIMSLMNRYTNIEINLNKLNF